MVTEGGADLRCMLGLAPRAENSRFMPFAATTDFFDRWDSEWHEDAALAKNEIERKLEKGTSPAFHVRRDPTNLLDVDVG